MGEQAVLDFLASKQPAWLPALFSSRNGYRISVVVRYLEAGVIPALPEGHSYYAELPQFVATKAAGRLDLAKQFLRENPGIVTRDLHFSIRLIARKGTESPFYLGNSYPDRTYRYFDRENGGRFTTLVLEEDFSVMKAVGGLCAEGVFEQFHDGLARYAAENRALLADTFRPMQKRALNFSAGKDSNGCAYPNLLVFTSRLVLLFGPNPPEPGGAVIEIPPLPGTAPWPAVYAERRFSRVMEFARSRIGELLSGIREGRGLPLLALPEFDLGFISPRTLLERFESYKNSGLAPGHFDFIQAIARCHCDGFAPGSMDLPSSDDEPSRVLRFLFSGEIHGAIATPSWWLTAARTREPLGDFSKHPQLGVHDREHSPDGCLPAVYNRPAPMRYSWIRTSPLLQELNDELPADHLYPLQHGGIIGDYGRYGSDLRWRYSFTPGLLDAVVAQDLQYTHEQAELTEKTSVNAISAVMSELARRRLPLRFLDLNKAWGGILGGKAKSLAARIAKAGAS